MDLSKIMSISGRGGLFRVISQLKNAVLVESLTDKHRFPAFAHEKISSLDEILVFTSGEDKPLKEILKAMHENLREQPAPDPKSEDNFLKSFFLEVVPDYDQERVYSSDIRKIMGWYNLLRENDMLDFTEEKKEEDKKEEEGKKEEVKKEEKQEEKQAEAHGKPVKKKEEKEHTESPKKATVSKKKKTEK